MQDDRRKGLLITVSGVLVITPDSLLVRLISADEWTILFWRGLLSSIAILLVLAILQRRRFLSGLLAIGRLGLGLAVMFSIGTVFFILSLEMTTVANTLFIVSTAPIFAAIMARLFLREAVSRRTLLTIAVTLIGVLIIAGGSAGGGPGSLLGDLAALVTAVSVAGTFTIARHSRPISMVPAMGISGLVTALIATVVSPPVALSQADAAYLAAMGLVVIPLSFSLMTIGPRYLPAPEVSLILLLEAVLAPLLIWLVLREYPGNASLLGGVIVLGALFLANLASFYDRPRR